jgi:GNAT superfamily N-acetyltransferase
MTTGAISVTRTYLELTVQPAAASRALPEGFAVRTLPDCSPATYRGLYAEVGRAHRWTDRLRWSDATLEAHLRSPSIRLFVLQNGCETAGWFELLSCLDGSVEIAYFGLLPAYIGRGLGGALLSAAIHEAFALGAARIWLHTCTLDHPAALPNYLARGFRPFRTEHYETEQF